MRRVGIIAVIWLVFFHSDVAYRFGVAGCAQADNDVQHLTELSSEEKRFLKLVSIPGYQSEATKLAKDNPARFLALLQSSQNVPGVLTEIVKSDLLWLLGRTEEAKTAIRLAGKQISRRSDQNWGTGFMPSDQFLDEVRLVHWSYEPVFRNGPTTGGGPNDNAVLKRLQDLGCTQEADAELARIWKLNQSSLDPFRLDAHTVDSDFLEYYTGQSPPAREFVLRPLSYNRVQLSIARVYALRLKEQGRDSDAILVMQVVLNKMDLDFEAGATRWNAIVPGTDSELPLRPLPYTKSSEMMTAPEFISFAFEHSRSMSRESELRSYLERRVSEGNLAVLRVLAHSAKANHNLALYFQLEQDYIDRSQFNEISKSYRRALLEQERGNYRQAIELFQKAASLPLENLNIPDPEANQSTDPKHSLQLFVDTIYFDPPPLRMKKAQKVRTALFRGIRESCYKLGDATCIVANLKAYIDPANGGTFDASSAKRYLKAARKVGPVAQREADAWVRAKLDLLDTDDRTRVLRALDGLEAERRDEDSPDKAQDELSTRIGSSPEQIVPH